MCRIAPDIIIHLIDQPEMKLFKPSLEESHIFNKLEFCHFLYPKQGIYLVKVVGSSDGIITRRPFSTATVIFLYG